MMQSKLKKKLKTDNYCCPRIRPGYIKDGDNHNFQEKKQLQQQQQHLQQLHATGSKNRPLGSILNKFYVYSMCILIRTGYIVTGDETTQTTDYLCSYYVSNCQGGLLHY